MNEGGQDFNTNLRIYSFTTACIGCPTSHAEVLGCGEQEYTPIGRKEKNNCSYAV